MRSNKTNSRPVQFGAIGRIATATVLLILLGVSCKQSTSESLNPDASTASPVDRAALASPSNEVSKPSPTPKEKFVRAGLAAPVGLFGYKVNGSWFQPAKEAPSGSYLYIDLGVVNTDSKERSLPPLMLRDEKGAEYQPSERAWKIKGSIGLIDKVPATGSKRANLIFEVPKNHQYRLKVQDGSPLETVLFELVPANKPPGS